MILACVVEGDPARRGSSVPDYKACGAVASDRRSRSQRRERTGKDRLAGHDRFIRSVAFSRNGTRVLTGSGMDWSHEEKRLVAGTDNTVRIRDVGTGEGVRVLTGQDNWVNIVSFNPDGSRILLGSGGHIEEEGCWTAGTDGTVRLWDARSGGEVRRFEGHNAPVRSVAFSPEGGFALSGATTASSVSDSCRYEHVFCGSRGWNGKDREPVAKFVKQKSKPKTLGFSRMGCRAGAITLGFLFGSPPERQSSARVRSPRESAAGFRIEPRRGQEHGWGIAAGDAPRRSGKARLGIDRASLLLGLFTLQSCGGRRCTQKPPGSSPGSLGTSTSPTSRNSSTETSSQ